MNRVINYLKNYIGVISIVLALCILLTYSLSYFKVNTESKRAAEMYIGELKYAISIDGTSTNTLSVPAGETIVDVDLTNQNEIKTYYKLLYLKNANISISYFNQTKNTSDEVTSYKSPSDVVESKSQNSLKLKIINNSSSNQTLTFKVSGGYSTNTLADVEVPNTYTEITSLETPSTNTYFCKTNDTLTQGLEYVDGQYTYGYEKEGKYSSSGLAWTNINNDGWGVQLTDKASTDAVTSKVCTYVNNKPIISTKYMFSYSKVATLDLSSFDTSKINNMNSMFYSSQATTLDLRNFNTSKVVNMSYMFSNSQATSLELSNFDTSNVTDISYMFYNSKATTIDGLNKFNTNKVTNMSHLFQSSQFTSLDLSRFNTSNVINMSYMFQSSKVTNLDLSNFDTSNVADMGSMFSSNELKTIDVSNFDTSNVTNMGSMFSNSKVTTLDLSNFDTSNVTNMSNMFNGSQATSIIGIEKFNTSKVTNMQGIFHSVKIDPIDISGFDTSHVTNMSYMFFGTKASTIDGLDKFNTSKVTNMSSMFESSQAPKLDLISFDTSNVTNMGSMFRNSSATAINGLEKFNTSKVYNMREMFLNIKIKTLDLSSFDTSNVTNMYQMFMNSNNLTTIYASDKFVTNKITDTTLGTYLFYNDTKLVGGAGTTYSGSKIDKTYARIDGGTSKPGYFTSAPEPSSFSSDSWSTIIYSVKKGNTSKYNVGDTKTVNLGTTYGTHTLRIANKSNPSECNNSGFSQTACGFVLEFVDSITSRNMNPTGTYKGTNYDFGYNVDGWPGSSAYTFINNDIYNLLPSDLKSGIIDTKTVSSHGKNETTNFVSTDKLYLLAPKEIYSDWNNSYDESQDLTRQLDYYKNNNVSTSNYSKAVKETGSSIVSWWLRSAHSASNTSFFYVPYSGKCIGADYAGTDSGISPAFRIG